MSDPQASTNSEEILLLTQLQAEVVATNQSFHEAIVKRNKEIAHAAQELGLDWRAIFHATGLAQSRQNQIIAEQS
jgi:hypothetical protein